MGLKRTKNYASKESICWDCKNGYPLKCAWIREMRQVWKKAKKQKRCEFYVYIVEQCEYYEPELRKRCAY